MQGIMEGDADGLEDRWWRERCYSFSVESDLSPPAASRRSAGRSLVRAFACVCLLASFILSVLDGIDTLNPLPNKKKDVGVGKHLSFGPKLWRRI